MVTQTIICGARGFTRKYFPSATRLTKASFNDSHETMRGINWNLSMHESEKKRSIDLPQTSNYYDHQLLFYLKRLHLYRQDVTQTLNVDVA